MEQDRTRSDNPKLSRRKFLALTGSTTGALILASCAAPAAPAPTAAPAAPAAPPPPKPTAQIAAAGVATVVPTVAAKKELQVGPAEISKIALGSRNPNYANQAMWQIATDKGWYKEEGLEVELVNTDNTKEGAIGGSLQIIHEDTAPMIRSIVDDKLPMTMIGPWRTGEFFGFVLRKEFKNGDDLDGKTLRNSPMGEREFLVRRDLLGKYGFKTEGAGGTARPNWVVTSGGSDPSAVMFVEGKLDGTIILPRHIKQVEPYGNVVYMEKFTWPQEGLWITTALST